MEVVVEVRVMTLPVITSVMVILYSVMIPFWVLAGGGDQESPMDVELTGERTTFWGGLLGAKNTGHN